ncbi:hypothetical protein [Campylobacter geochelonis]|uniref:hypothetical protein n=1 Tax=Campylobacter geochelonis TaxID=1780362 RepID=UPI0013F4CD97|nr:hypothetical protein [Campylobacter geochelonis]
MRNLYLKTHKDKTVCARNDDALEFYKENKDIVLPFFYQPKQKKCSKFNPKIPQIWLLQS